MTSSNDSTDKSIFTKILEGSEPGEVLYENGAAFIILTRAPNKPGHSLVVPKRQVELFYDMEGEEYTYLLDLARRFAVVLQEVFRPKVVALEIMGLGVSHVHVHLVPIEAEADLDKSRAIFVPLEQIAPAAERVRAYLADHPLEGIQ